MSDEYDIHNQEEALAADAEYIRAMEVEQLERLAHQCVWLNAEIVHAPKGLEHEVGTKLLICYQCGKVHVDE